MNSFDNNSVGRFRRPWCYHKRGISLDDHLGTNNNLDEDLLASKEGTSVYNMESEEIEEDSLAKRFAKILSCEEMADVHFILGSSNAQKLFRIPAHKLVLAVGSPVFKAMFYGPMATCTNSSEDIKLPDIEPIIFLEFLRYLYTDGIKLKRDNVVQLLYAARKYDIPGLERICVEYLKYSINEKNVLVIWQTAKLFDEKEFQYLCLKVIEKNAHQVLLGADFLELDHETVCFFLNDDLLRIDEVNLFRALARWGKNHCLRRGICPTRVNIREALGDAISLIRFPLMTEEQLIRNVASEGILEDDVLQTLLRNFKTWPRMENPKIFSNTPRAFQRLQNNLITVQRFTSYDNQIENHFTNRTLNFSVSQTIFIAGIGVYGPRKACTFYLKIFFNITKCGCPRPTTIEQEEKCVLIKCDGTTPIINVKFDNPFEVEPETCYQITAKITPTNRTTSIVRSKFNPLLYYTKAQEINYYYGTGGQKIVEAKIPNKCESVLFSFYWDELNDDESETTSVMPTTSAPSTPNPPPRPPLPKEYRMSRLSKLRRALSFTSDSRNTEPNPQDKLNLLKGQIPVIMFYA